MSCMKQPEGEILPEVGGTTAFGIPFNACGSCPAAKAAAIGLMYVPCAVAAAIIAACCCKRHNIFKVQLTQIITLRL